MFLILGILSIFIGFLAIADSSGFSTLTTLFRSYQAIASSFYVIAVCLLLAGVLLILCKNGEKTRYIQIASIAYALGTIAGIFHLGYGDLPLFTVVSAAFCAITARWLYKKGLLKIQNFSHKKDDE